MCLALILGFLSGLLSDLLHRATLGGMTAESEHPASEKGIGVNPSQNYRNVASALEDEDLEVPTTRCRRA